MPLAPKRSCSVAGCLQYAEAIGRCREHAAPILKLRGRARRNEPGRRLYATSRWRSLRMLVLREEPLCRRCMNEDHRPVPATDIDHVVAHKGDPGRFWHRDNLQPLCAACHHRKTATERGGEASRLPVEVSRKPTSMV